jgi:hypothetical protein
VSFLLCFACRNALATARHLPRIVYLFQALESLRSVVPAAVWKADWEAHHRRVSDLLDQHTDPRQHSALLARLTGTEREFEPAGELSEPGQRGHHRAGRNHRARATMSPLLVWALRCVLDLAPDIIDAHRAWRRLKLNIRPSNAAPADGLRLVRAHLQHLKASGGTLPAYIGHTGQRLGNHWRVGAADERPLINISFLAGQLGVTRHQVETGLLELGPDLGGLPVAEGAALPVDVTGRIDGKVWANAIDFTEAQSLAGHLMTAALLTIGYLSGMRPEEVLHLERGCSSQEEREDGTVRYRVTGRHFKGVTDEDGNILPGGEIRPEPWAVIELVDRAVKVLEQLHDDRLLFPRSLTVRTLEPTPAEIRAEGVLPRRWAACSRWPPRRRTHRAPAIPPRLRQSPTR